MSYQDPSLPPLRPKRAYHKKNRTGCITCKARKLRCDEQKPECERCVSTGRKCDGYASSNVIETRTNGHVISPSSPFDAHSHCPAKELKLALSRRNFDELRSYQYFLEVSAPSLSGVFFGDFWLSEIPRVCQSDPAIWHAVVSLGAAYEAYATSGHSEKENQFVLKQFNSSIKCLTEASSRRGDRWRASTVSVIFTFICSIQGLHKEARMHLAAGCNLLQEIEKDTIRRRNMANSLVRPYRPNQEKTFTHGISTSIPISMGPLRAILINLDSQARALDNGGLSQELRLITDNDSFHNWRSYVAPCKISDIPTNPPLQTLRRIEYATQENFVRAHRAAESLLSGMVIFSQQHASMMGEVLTSGKLDNLEILISRQQPFTSCFKQLSIAIRIFKLEVDTNPSSTPYKPPNSIKSLLTLMLFHSTVRLLFIRDPEIPDGNARRMGFPMQYSYIVDMIERILKLEIGKSPTFIPSASISSPLSLVALVGSPNSTRLRALELMRRYPHRDGLWDTSFTAKLVEAVMGREKLLIRQAIGGANVNTGFFSASEESHYGTEEDITVPPLFQMHNMRISFEARRRAMVKLTSWQEWIAGKEVDGIILDW